MDLARELLTPSAGEMKMEQMMAEEKRAHDEKMTMMKIFMEEQKQKLEILLVTVEGQNEKQKKISEKVNETQKLIEKTANLRALNPI